MSYSAQKHLKPKALSGISDEQIDQHWQLYESYVKNTNEILEELGEAESGSHHWSELKRRLGFEFNGMALHGIGWVILYHEPATGSLFNWWISDHEINHPAGLNPILVMDVFEHAWMVDYGAGAKGKYIDAFLDNVAWEV